MRDDAVMVIHVKPCDSLTVDAVILKFKRGRNAADTPRASAAAFAVRA